MEINESNTKQVRAQGYEQEYGMRVRLAERAIAWKSMQSGLGVVECQLRTTCKDIDTGLSIFMSDGVADFSFSD